ncbi:hypothetical protein [Kitasatospora sp. NPDC085464]|uniref:hypothetical protein n=1 Tax=Kitasatospora sp. NPDC085464 TaxID=3364063 RepID=UPI0037C95B4C
MVRLIRDDELVATSVVANSTMNRERGLSGVNSYARSLGFDPLAWLRERDAAVPGWLDLCSGEGRALAEAARQLPRGGAELTGVDLVGPMAPPPDGAARGPVFEPPPAGRRRGTHLAALSSVADAPHGLPPPPCDARTPTPPRPPFGRTTGV